MVSKNNFHNKMIQDAKRVPHYGIRKLSVGVASVLLGTTLYFGAAGVAHAATVAGSQSQANIVQSSQRQSVKTKNNIDSSSDEVNSSAGDKNIDTFSESTSDVDKSGVETDTNSAIQETNSSGNGQPNVTLKDNTNGINGAENKAVLVINYRDITDDKELPSKKIEGKPGEKINIPVPHGYEFVSTDDQTIYDNNQSVLVKLQHHIITLTDGDINPITGEKLNLSKTVTYTFDVEGPSDKDTLLLKWEPGVGFGMFGDGTDTFPNDDAKQVPQKDGEIYYSYAPARHTSFKVRYTKNLTYDVVTKKINTGLSHYEVIKEVAKGNKKIERKINLGESTGDGHAVGLPVAGRLNKIPHYKVEFSGDFYDPYANINENKVSENGLVFLIPFSRAEDELYRLAFMAYNGYTAENYSKLTDQHFLIRYIGPESTTYQSTTYQFVDDDNNEAKVGAPVTISGVTDQTVTIKYQVPEGYELAVDQPSTYTFGASDNKPFTVHLKQKKHVVVEADIKQIETYDGTAKNIDINVFKNPTIILKTTGNKLGLTNQSDSSLNLTANDFEITHAGSEIAKPVNAGLYEVYLKDSGLSKIKKWDNADQCYWNDLRYPIKVGTLEIQKLQPILTLKCQGDKVYDGKPLAESDYSVPVSFTYDYKIEGKKNPYEIPYLDSKQPIELEAGVDYIWQNIETNEKYKEAPVDYGFYKLSLTKSGYTKIHNCSFNVENIAWKNADIRVNLSNDSTSYTIMPVPTIASLKGSNNGQEPTYNGKSVKLPLNDLMKDISASPDYGISIKGLSKNDFDWYDANGVKLNNAPKEAGIYYVKLNDFGSSDIENDNKLNYEIKIGSENSYKFTIKANVTFNFVDDASGKVVLSQNQAMFLNTDTSVSLKVPQNYQLADDEDQPLSYTARTSNPVVTLKVTHKKTHVSHDNPKKPGDKTPTGKLINGAQEKDLNQTITRTINVIAPDGKKTTTKQVAKLYRDAEVDDVTGDVTYGDWSSDSSSWSDFKPDVVTGYTVSQSDVPAVEVKNGQQNVTVNITYNADGEVAHIVYFDDEANREIDHEDVTGKFGDVIKFTKDPAEKIAELQKQGYVLVSDNFDNEQPKNSLFMLLASFGPRTFDNESSNNMFEVHFKHDRKVINPDEKHHKGEPIDPTNKDPKAPIYTDEIGDKQLSKAITQKVSKYDITGKSYTTDSQTLNYQRGAALDTVTGKIDTAFNGVINGTQYHHGYSEWAPKNELNKSFKEVALTPVDGYRADAPVQASTPTASDVENWNDQDHVFTLKYVAENSHQDFHFVDQDGQPVSTDRKTGKTGENVPTPDIPTGWVQIGQPTDSDGKNVDINKLQFKPADKATPIIISVEHGTIKVTPQDPKTPAGEIPNDGGQKFPNGVDQDSLNKVVTRTITVNTPNAVPTTITQTAKLSRTANVDKVTKNVTYGAWSVDKNNWVAYSAPEIDGYTADSDVKAVAVDGNTKDTAVVINYIAENSHQTFHLVDQDGNPITDVQVPGKTGEKKTGNDVPVPDGWTPVKLPADFTIQAPDKDTPITVVIKRNDAGNTKPAEKPNNQTPINLNEGNEDQLLSSDNNDRSSMPNDVTSKTQAQDVAKDAVTSVETNNNQQTTSTSKQVARQLPQTGDQNNAAVVALGALTGLFGLGLTTKKRKN